MRTLLGGSDLVRVLAVLARGRGRLLRLPWSAGALPADRRLDGGRELLHPKELLPLTGPGQGFLERNASLPDEQEESIVHETHAFLRAHLHDHRDLPDSILTDEVRYRRVHDQNLGGEAL